MKVRIFQRGSSPTTLEVAIISSHLNHINMLCMITFTFFHFCSVFLIDITSGKVTICQWVLGTPRACADSLWKYFWVTLQFSKCFSFTKNKGQLQYKKVVFDFSLVLFRPTTDKLRNYWDQKSVCMTCTIFCSQSMSASILSSTATNQTGWTKRSALSPV